jgi:hypothetical protein
MCAVLLPPGVNKCVLYCCHRVSTNVCCTDATGCQQMCAVLLPPGVNPIYIIYIKIIITRDNGSYCFTVDYFCNCSKLLRTRALCLFGWCCLGAPDFGVLHNVLVLGGVVQWGTKEFFRKGGVGLRQEFFFGWVQQIQLRTEDRGSPLVRGSTLIANQ